MEQRSPSRGGWTRSRCSRRAAAAQRGVAAGPNARPLASPVVVSGARASLALPLALGSLSDEHTRPSTCDASQRWGWWEGRILGGSGALVEARSAQVVVDGHLAAVQHRSASPRKRVHANLQQLSARQL